MDDQTDATDLSRWTKEKKDMIKTFVLVVVVLALAPVVYAAEASTSDEVIVTFFKTL
jgi:hypothetical protein